MPARGMAPPLRRLRALALGIMYVQTPCVLLDLRKIVTLESCKAAAEIRRTRSRYRKIAIGHAGTMPWSVTSKPQAASARCTG
jgi:hypothetical protein